MAFRKKQKLKRAHGNRGANLADKHPRVAKVAPAVPLLRGALPALDGESRFKVPALEPKRVPALATEGGERERGSYDADTAIKLYLREIGQVKLLTPQQEIELAAK